ncbi:right-handed parallel beta-helix repeat-containing protein [Paenibacillus sp. IITD108]|uniref:right-handed parallel beta-helix repeat-containing protein n=1 Tax=Paenibacillus sp. IITD108 TaxID=3116649 RepID=UPI002F3F4B21
MSATFNLYVDPSGDDRNSGTANAPLATLSGARDAIRAIKHASGMPKGGITVYIREGLYRHEESFVLEEQDSGTPEAPIVYTAAEGEEVRISGGIPLSAEHFLPVTEEAVRARLQADVRDRVLQIDLKALGLNEFGQISKSGFGFPAVAANPELFFNGSTMTLARYPNEGYVKIEKVIDPGGNPREYDGDKVKIAEELTKAATFRFKDDRPLHWINTGDIWMYGYWQWDWADGNLRIASIDASSHSLTTEGASYYSMRADQRYYYYNILEELDTPGEWYLDRQKGILYFYPPGPLETAEAELSLLVAPLVLLRNTSHVTFSHLTFEVSRGAGIQIIGGSDNIVAGCTLRRLGSMAVIIGEESSGNADSATKEREERYIRGGRRNGVVHCKIYDTGTGGILLSGGDRITLEAGGNYARCNDISRYSRLKLTYSAAVELMGVGHIAANNYIHHAPHVGILLYGNDHTVEYNEVYKVLMETGDAGAIYIGRDWTEQGNTIRYNFIHHIHNDVSQAHMGIYLDDMASGVEMYGNVLYDVDLAVLIGGGRSNILRNNLILNCARSVQLDARSMPGEWAANHSLEGQVMHRRLLSMPIHAEPWRSKYPALLTLWEDMPSCPKYNVVERNVIYKTGVTSNVDGDTVSDHEDTMLIHKYARQYGVVEQNWVTSEELSFVDANEQNFALKPDSPVFRHIPGFENIPFAKIGLKNE